MLFVKLIVSFCAIWLVKGDLLDLYVQHMDETMKTLAYKKNHHPRGLGHKIRSKRNTLLEPDHFKIGILKKQRLEVDEDYWRQLKLKKISQKKRPIEKSDGLNFPNEREEFPRNDQHEFVEKNLKNIHVPLNDSDSKIERFYEYQSFFDDKSVEDELDTEYSQVEILEDKLEKEKTISKPFDDPVVKKDPNTMSRIPKKYYPDDKRPKYLKKSAQPQEKQKNDSSFEARGRFKRNVKQPNFTRHEVLDDDGHVFLQWDPTDDEIVTFNVTAKTLGYVGIGFNDHNHMKGADILIGWVDSEGNVNLLDSHGIEDDNAAPVTDLSQDVTILSGSENGTHTTITFSRKWQTCDPNDRQLSADNVRVLWAMHESDPELNTPVGHGEKRGGRALRLRAPGPKPVPPYNPEVRHWDVKLNQFAVTKNQDTIYWCKIFKAPALHTKHHMIGYEPLVEKENRGLVHHMILYECASTLPILGQHARLAGAPCYGATMPREWDSCIQPVVAWARGSRGEWFAEDVGIPIAEHKEGSYYMLEVHYNNPGLRDAIDSSGVRLHVTPNLRPKEAGILVTGVAVNPLHMIPPRQKAYATAGYCTDACTRTLFPEDGINAVSVVLHSHLAGRRMSLKHIRQGEELAPIVQENHFDFDYQQSHTLEEEVKIMPGDELVTECVYGTQDRNAPTLGGYAATQEMCLAFVVYYPRTELAGCYSITPAEDLFTTLGVHSFKGITMEHLEKLFLTTGTDAAPLPTNLQQQLAGYAEFEKEDDLDLEMIRVAESALRAMRDYSEDRDSDNVFTRLIIEKPKEFQGLTLAQHMLALPWSEEVFARPLENNLYHGKHMTFCRKRDDKLALPAETVIFPNYTALPEMNKTTCSDLRLSSGSEWTSINRWLIPLVIYILSLSLL